MIGGASLRVCNRFLALLVLFLSRLSCINGIEIHVTDNLKFVTKNGSFNVLDISEEAIGQIFDSHNFIENIPGGKMYSASLNNTDYRIRFDYDGSILSLSLMCKFLDEAEKPVLISSGEFNTIILYEGIRVDELENQLEQRNLNSEVIENMSSTLVRIFFQTGVNLSILFLEEDAYENIYQIGLGINSR